MEHADSSTAPASAAASIASMSERRLKRARRSASQSSYQLLSLTHNWRVRLRAYASEGEPPVIDSVIDIWAAANWYEREAFDLYGILFNGHPDLRRLLTDYGFIGHPFRKDFPLIGNVEVQIRPGKGRVVYQPVSIEPRTLVPRVIREDNRYDAGAQGRAGRCAEPQWLRSAISR